MTAREIYDKVIAITPKIDTSNAFKTYLTSQNYMRFTSKYSFEELVWKLCDGDKNLANEVMEIAEQELKNNLK